MVFTDRPINCKDCGQLIGFNGTDKHPFNVTSHGSEFFQITDIPHFQTCPRKVALKIAERCAWCHFDANEDILSFGNLIDYMKCQSHSDEKAEISYRGKSLPMTNKTLHLIHDDALKSKKRKIKMKQLESGNQAMDAFLGS